MLSAKGSAGGELSVSVEGGVLGGVGIGGVVVLGAGIGGVVVLGAGIGGVVVLGAGIVVLGAAFPGNWPRGKVRGSWCAVGGCWHHLMPLPGRPEGPSSFPYWGQTAIGKALPFSPRLRVCDPSAL